MNNETNKTKQAEGVEVISTGGILNDKKTKRLTNRKLRRNANKLLKLNEGNE